MANHSEPVVINLASKEYFKVMGDLNADVVTPLFKERRGAQLKQISFFAKRARGAMARWIIDNEVNSVEKLVAFDADGYRYSGDGMTHGEPLFVRDQS